MKKNDEWSATEELLKHKSLYLYTCAFALLCSLIVSLSIPRQYVSRIIVTPETKFLELVVGAPGGVISKFFKDASAWTTAGADIYNEILHSDDFREKVKNIYVETSDGNFKGNYEDYLNDKMNYPWFYNLFYEHSINDIVDENVKYALNRKNATITIQVSSCDPILSATMPERIKSLLQEKITERYHVLYKNRTADIDRELVNVRKEYYDKMNEYIKFTDSNQETNIQKYQAVEKTLSLEVKDLYATCERLQTMKERFDMLSKKGDSYLTTLVNPIVARNATNPHYIANALIWLFYSIIFTTLFILYRKKIRIIIGKETA